MTRCKHKMMMSRSPCNGHYTISCVKCDKSMNVPTKRDKSPFPVLRTVHVNTYNIPFHPPFPYDEFITSALFDDLKLGEMFESEELMLLFNNNEPVDTEATGIVYMCDTTPIPFTKRKPGT